VASNAGNWEWVAGTGHNTGPNRVMNPLRQARRFDPPGDYVRRYVPELAGLPPARIHPCGGWTPPSAAASATPIPLSS
jgi:deoxyribodipyrimidine photo-lyase